jgi:hypothetical protein
MTVRAPRRQRGHGAAAAKPTLWLGIARLLCVAAAGLEGLPPHHPAAGQGVAALLLLQLGLLPL